MNKKLIISLSMFIVAFASCKKTYVCQTSNGISVGQVEARSSEKAKDLCPPNSIVLLNE